MTLTVTCWSDEDPAVRATRNHDNLMCERDYRDANPPADGWDDLSDLLASPTNGVPYDALDGIDVPYEREDAALVALVGDDGRDEFGETREERAEPQREVA